MTLRDLLYALLLPSANDASVAIADHVGGSVSNFVSMMNNEAAAIGAHRTHFDNPHGLDSSSHYSTAYDLALIARYALRNKTFAEIVSTRTRQLSGSGVVATHNLLLSSYPGATGVKTGYTSGAGNCLVSSATRGNVSLIAVELGVKQRRDMFTESAALFDYGFGLYKEKKPISSGVVYKTINSQFGQKVDLVAKADVHATVRDSLPIHTEAHYVADIPMPVKKGTVLGKVVSYQAGRVVATADLAVKDATEQPTLTQIAQHYVSPFADTVFQQKNWRASA
jgi:D-alanyl-D-alanine carboxypeptidase (penicillin-binding protein 5/6)